MNKLFANSQEALEALIRGNQRFVNGESYCTKMPDKSSFERLKSGQDPFAILLSCSDSRIVPEIVFDQPLGALFVIRVAGNIATDSQVESIAFALEAFNPRLLIVLGHSGCAAVTVALKAVFYDDKLLAEKLPLTTEMIVPGLNSLYKKLKDEGSEIDPELSEKFIDRGVHANTRYVLQSLENDSRVIAARGSESSTLFTGAFYSLHSGKVSFYR